VRELDEVRKDLERVMLERDELQNDVQVLGERSKQGDVLVLEKNAQIAELRLRVCACVYVYMYTCICIYMQTHTHIHVCVCARAPRARARVDLHICAYAFDMTYAHDMNVYDVRHVSFQVLDLPQVSGAQNPLGHALT